MKLQEIYINRRQRPGPDWVDGMKTAILQVAPKLSDDGTNRGVFCVPFGEHNYPFPATGDVSLHAGFTPEGKKALSDMGVLAEAGELPVACHFDGVEIPVGAVLVTGLGNSGKTPFAHALAEAICQTDEPGFGLLRYGEPFAGYLKSEYVAGHELAHLMAHHRAVVVDSVKDLLTDMSGSATESGIARKAVSMFSRMSMVATEVGSTVIIPINPSSVKTTVQDLMNEVARSNVAMAAINEGDKWAILARTGEGRMRAEATARMHFVDGLPRITFNSGAEGQAEAKDIVSMFEAAARPDSTTLVAAAKRLANRQN